MLISKWLLYICSNCSMLHRLTTSSTGHICKKDIIARFIEMKWMQSILVGILLHMSHTCLVDFVHPRRLKRSGGTYFPYLTQQVIMWKLLISNSSHRLTILGMYNFTCCNVMTHGISLIKSCWTVSVNNRYNSSVNLIDHCQILEKWHRIGWVMLWQQIRFGLDSSLSASMKEQPDV